MFSGLRTVSKDECTLMTYGAGTCKGCGKKIKGREVHYRAANWVICPTCHHTLPDRPKRSSSSSTSNVSGHKDGDEIVNKLKFWIVALGIIGVIIFKGFEYLKNLIMN